MKLKQFNKYKLLFQHLKYPLLALLTPSYSMTNDGTVTFNESFIYDPEEYGNNPESTHFALLCNSIFRTALQGENAYKAEVARINQKAHKKHLPNQLLNTEYLTELLGNIKAPLIPIITGKNKNLLVFSFTTSNYSSTLGRVPSYNSLVNQGEFADLLSFVRFALFEDITDKLFKDSKAHNSMMNVLFQSSVRVLESLLYAANKFPSQKAPTTTQIFGKTTDNSILLQECENAFRPLLNKMKAVAKEMPYEANPFYGLTTLPKKEKLTNLQKKLLSVIGVSLISFKDLVVTDLAIFFNLFSNRVIKDEKGNSVTADKHLATAYDLLRECRKYIVAKNKEEAKNLYKDSTLSTIYSTIHNLLKIELLPAFHHKDSSFYNTIAGIITESNGVFPIFIHYGDEIAHLFLSGPMIKKILNSNYIDQEQTLSALLNITTVEKNSNRKKMLIMKIFSDVLFVSTWTAEQKESFFSKNRGVNKKALTVISKYFDQEEMKRELERLNMQDIYEININKDDQSKQVTIQNPYNNVTLPIPRTEEIYANNKNTYFHEEQVSKLANFFAIEK